MNNVLLNGTKMGSVKTSLDRIRKRTGISQKIGFISKIPSFQKYMPACRLTHKLLIGCLHSLWGSLTLVSVQNALINQKYPDPWQTQQCDIFMETHLLNRLKIRKWLRTNLTKGANDKNINVSNIKLSLKTGYKVQSINTKIPYVYHRRKCN